MFRSVASALRGTIPLWCVLVLHIPAGAVVLAALFAGLVALEDHAPGELLDPLAYAWLGLFLLYLAGGALAVWQSAAHSHRLMRYPARAAAVLVPFCLMAAIFTPHGHSYGPRWKVLEAVNLAHPARTALGIACSERSLRPGMGHLELGLEAPEVYAHTWSRSVEAIVDSPVAVRVTITMKEIPDDGWFSGSPAVRAGETVVFNGTCAADVMTWTVSGTVAQRYLPKY